MRWWIAFWLVVSVLSLLAIGQAPPASAATASCYADTTDGFLGQTAADGSTVRSSTIGVASRTLTLGTVLMVKIHDRAPVRATVIDRGPYAQDSDGNYTRSLDLTWGAARVLGYQTCRAWGVRDVRTWRAR